MIFLRGCGSASSTPQNIQNEHLNTTKDTPDGSIVTWFWTHTQVLKKCGTTKPPSFLSWSVGETHAAWIRWNMGMARNFSQRHVEFQVFNKSRYLYGAETQKMLEIPMCRSEHFRTILQFWGISQPFNCRFPLQNTPVITWWSHTASGRGYGCHLPEVLWRHCSAPGPDLARCEEFRSRFSGWWLWIFWWIFWMYHW